MSRPSIALIATGGTFAMQPRGPFDWVEYSESGTVHPPDRLLERLGDLQVEADIVPIAFRAVGSTRIGPNDWLELAALLRKSLDSGKFSGVVITHGTATLEETAFFLQLTVTTDLPIVLTGAQRPPDTAGSDARGNLRAAIAAAADPRLCGCGVLVVMDNHVFAARDVTKTSSGALHAFQAPEFGPLARVEADASLSLRRLPTHRAGLSGLQLPERLPRVDISVSYAGADGAAISAYVAAGARGIICAGLLPGRPADGEWGAVRSAIAAGVVVVQSTRGPSGNVVPQAFLERDGILAGGDLAPQKVRIGLMLALTLSTDPRVLQRTLLSI